MSSDIMAKAKELGLLLAQSEEFIKVREAEMAIMQNSEAQSIIHEFESVQHTLQDLEDQGQPLSEEQHKNFEELHKKMFTNTYISNLFKAQESFESILNKVNRIISTSIGIDQECDCEDEGEHGHGCSCGCS